MTYLVRSINSAAMIILFACAGCAQMAYDTLKNTQSIDCRKLQGAADRTACMNRSDMSYEEYQRQLDKQKQESKK
jgi:uncharacterized protein